MTNITAAAVSSLRARTGVSILAVKQALEEANGDEELAIELLRKRGIAQAVKKADREQSEGGFFLAQNDTRAALVQIKCETDFVGRGDDFQSVGQSIADALLKDGMDAAKAEVEAKIPAAVQRLGENISVGDMELMDAPAVGAYVHSNRKIAVLIGVDKAGAEYAAKAKDVAMHAAAMNPQYTTPEDVPAEAVEKEREIWKEQMKDEKKPAEILEKIMLGKERKFREENSLTTQAFVKDNSMTVGKYLGDAKVTNYTRASF
jgi:elongation factor Ts